MCSRLLCILALLMVACSARAEMGGHRLEFVAGLDYVNFDEEIRFENGVQTSIALLAEVLSGVSLGLELNHASVRDRDRDTFADVFNVAIRGRVEPWSGARLGLGAVMGVSFLAFENQPNIDSVSEGFEFGPTLRLNLDSTWRVRAELLWRIQTVSRVRVDDAGQPTGDQDETGYLWSSLARLGVGIAF